MFALGRDEFAIRWVRRASSWVDGDGVNGFGCFCDCRRHLFRAVLHVVQFLEHRQQLVRQQRMIVARVEHRASRMRDARGPFEETLDLPYFGLFQLDWTDANPITGCRRAKQAG